MSRAQTLTALVAVVLASLAALQLPGRLVYALGAVVLLAAVGLMRLRALVTTRRSRAESTFDPAARAAQIRETRDRKYDR